MVTTDYKSAFYLELLLKSTETLQLIQNAMMWRMKDAPYYTHVLLYELHQLPARCKSRCWLCTGDLFILRPPTSNSFAIPIRSGRIIVLQIASMKQCHLSEPRRHAFSVTVLALWNSILLQIHKAFTLQLFCKSLKTQLWSQAGPKVTTKSVRFLCRIIYSRLFYCRCPCLFFFIHFIISIANKCKLPRLAESWIISKFN